MKLFYVIFIIFNIININPVSSNTNIILSCKGVQWLNSKTIYAEWEVIKRIPKYKVIFYIDDKIKVAKFSIRKGNAGTIIGLGGWDLKTGEKSSLSITYSLTTKIFKVKSRYNNLRIEGKCLGNFQL